VPYQLHSFLGFSQTIPGLTVKPGVLKTFPMKNAKTLSELSKLEQELKNKQNALQAEFDKKRLAVLGGVRKEIEGLLQQALDIFVSLPVESQDALNGHYREGVAVSHSFDKSDNHGAIAMVRTNRRAKSGGRTVAGNTLEPKKRKTVNVEQLLAAMEIGKPYQQTYLAKQVCGVTDAAIKTHLVELKTKGILTVEDRGKGKGKGNHWTRVK
jgi:hypothetical protein